MVRSAKEVVGLVALNMLAYLWTSALGSTFSFPYEVEVVSTTWNVLLACTVAYSFAVPRGLLEVVPKIGMVQLFLMCVIAVYTSPAFVPRLTNQGVAFVWTLLFTVAVVLAALSAARKRRGALKLVARVDLLVNTTPILGYAVFIARDSEEFNWGRPDPGEYFNNREMHDYWARTSRQCDQAQEKLGVETFQFAVLVSMLLLRLLAALSALPLCGACCDFLQESSKPVLWLRTMALSNLALTQVTFAPAVLAECRPFFSVHAWIALTTYCLGHLSVLLATMRFDRDNTFAEHHAMRQRLRPGAVEFVDAGGEARGGLLPGLARPRAYSVDYAQPGKVLRSPLVRESALLEGSALVRADPSSSGDGHGAAEIELPVAAASVGEAPAPAVAYV